MSKLTYLGNGQGPLLGKGAKMHKYDAKSASKQFRFCNGMIKGNSCIRVCKESWKIYTFSSMNQGILKYPTDKIE